MIVVRGGAEAYHPLCRAGRLSVARAVSGEPWENEHAWEIDQDVRAGRIFGARRRRDIRHSGHGAICQPAATGMRGSVFQRVQQPLAGVELHESLGLHRNGNVPTLPGYQWQLSRDRLVGQQRGVEARQPRALRRLRRLWPPWTDPAREHRRGRTRPLLALSRERRPGVLRPAPIRRRAAASARNFRSHKDHGGHKGAAAAKPQGPHSISGMEALRAVRRQTPRALCSNPNADQARGTASGVSLLRQWRPTAASTGYWTVSDPMFVVRGGTQAYHCGVGPTFERVERAVLGQSWR
jgi:hypothetical protein